LSGISFQFSGKYAGGQFRGEGAAAQIEQPHRESSKAKTGIKQGQDWNQARPRLESNKAKTGIKQGQDWNQAMPKLTTDN
jgi:hypothetical protein